jgi:hypothetical protein
MLNSATGVFREPADVQKAMREYGCTNLVLIADGSFRTRLARIALHRLRLLSADEALARIAFFSVPNDATLVSFPLGGSSWPFWGLTAPRAGEIVTLSGAQRSHTRSASRCRWAQSCSPASFF